MVLYRTVLKRVKHSTLKEFLLYMITTEEPFWVLYRIIYSTFSIILKKPFTMQIMQMVLSELRVLYTTVFFTEEPLKHHYLVLGLVFCNT
ncbi:hypothetical protein MHYP_G00127600 [Metynnis hypsauchen]